MMDFKILNFLKETDRIIEGKRQPFVTCEIDIANTCQNRCYFCHYKNYLNKDRSVMTWSTFSDVIFEVYQMEAKSITLSGGGEPLTNPFAEKMIWAAYDLGLEIGLITNGIFLDRVEGVLDKFQFIRISLDAATPKTYEAIKGNNVFDEVIENVRMCVGKTDVGLSMVVTEKNKQEVEGFRELAESLGVSYAQIKPAWKISGIESTMRNISDEGLFKVDRYSVELDSNLPCQIAGLIGQVGANGKVYYCCVHRGNPDFIIGDVNEESLEDIWARRNQFKPDLRICGSCRYINYAKVYEKVRDKRFTPLRHRNFL